MNIFKNKNFYFLLVILGFTPSCWNKKKKSIVKTIPVAITAEETCNTIPTQDLPIDNCTDCSTETDNITNGPVECFDLAEEDNPFENNNSNSKEISLSPTIEEEDNIGKTFDAETKKNLFKTVYFNYDQYSIRNDQLGALSYNLQQAKDLVQQNNMLVIEGHACNSAGTDQYNMMLSEDRAKSIARYFIANGIDKSNIQTVGFGCKIPIIEYGNKEQQAPNRRVEIKSYLKI